jgi:hypothetical protein
MGITLGSRRRRQMIVPSEYLSCCAFVGFRKADGTEVWAGTAFYLSRKSTSRPELSFRYTVTAAHVIRSIVNLGVDHILLRCNRVGGGVGYEETRVSDWVLHPSRTECDVAVLMGVPDEQWDIRLLEASSIVPLANLAGAEVGVGTDVFWTGLFTSHSGVVRNEPLARFGRVAAVPVDGIPTRIGNLAAYLIDGVPLGGFSGAPVFSNLGMLKVEGGTVRTANRPVIRLIGLIHGHFQMKGTGVEGVGTAEEMTPRLHTGIAIVIRADEILEMLSLDVVREAEGRA